MTIKFVSLLAIVNLHGELKSEDERIPTFFKSITCPNRSSVRVKTANRRRDKQEDLV